MQTIIVTGKTREFRIRQTRIQPTHHRHPGHLVHQVHRIRIPIRILTHLTHHIHHRQRIRKVKVIPATAIHRIKSTDPDVGSTNAEGHHRSHLTHPTRHPRMTTTVNQADM